MIPFVAVRTSVLLAGSASALEYPAGIKPGDQISSTSGEFFRYTSVLVKPPDDNDRSDSLAMAKDVKCDVCEKTVKSLMDRVESNSEDHIMDQFDGTPDFVEPSDNEQETRVNQYKKGCNKHYKDEMLIKGYYIKTCDEQPRVTVTLSDDSGKTPEPVQQKTWCLYKSEDGITGRDVNTYSKYSEGVFYSCEQTIGKYGMEMAESLAEQLEDGLGKGSLEAAIAKTCREAAFCTGLRPPRGRKKDTKAASQSEAPKKKDEPKKKEEPMKNEQVKKKVETPKKKEDHEKSYLEMLEEDEDMIKMRRRRKKKPHTEL